MIAYEGRSAIDVARLFNKLDDTNLDAVLAKAEEMGRQLAAKRERLEEIQRAGRRPKVRSVREQNVVAALGKLRDLLQAAVGVAAQVLKAIVGDVVIETRQIEGQEKPQMVARFTINAVPARAVLDRGGACGSEGSSWPVACSQQPAESTNRATTEEVVVPLNRKCHRSSGDLTVIPPADSQPPQE
jgi:hypothetical protein